jgi:hypothetical protein
MTCQQLPNVRLLSVSVVITGGQVITPFEICIDLRKHFQEIARKYSLNPAEPRHVHTFFTTAIVRPVFFLR